MTTVNVYLTFDGTCEEAFQFYRSVFGGEFSGIDRFNSMPPADGMPPMTEAQGNQIMHISLPVSSETTLMGSDIGPMAPMNLVQGNNFSITVNTDDVGEGKRLFQALSENGQVTMPMEKTFWEAYFGMCTDRFGVNWMVNVPVK